MGRDVAEDPAAFMRIAEADNDATEMTGGAAVRWGRRQRQRPSGRGGGRAPFSPTNSRHGTKRRPPICQRGGLKISLVQYITSYDPYAARRIIPRAGSVRPRLRSLVLRMGPIAPRLLAHAPPAARGLVRPHH